jgi:hypothetical protein
VIPANEQDVGPYPVDHVVSIWGRIARMAEALHAVGAIARAPQQLRELVDACAAGGSIDHDDITRTLRVLALQDGMHAGDWLRARAVEAGIPRRKPPAPLDLQMRLRSVQCQRLVARLVRISEDGRAYEGYRVTIMNVRGDVASAESSSLANALEGAIKMAGARSETTEES